MVAPTTKGLTRLGISLLQESVMTYVYALLATQAVNPGKIIVGNDGVARMIQKSFMEKVEYRIRADNRVDNIIELYERTLQHSTATGTIMVHERVTKIPSNLVIKPKEVIVSSPVKAVTDPPVRTETQSKVVDIKPPRGAFQLLLVLVWEQYLVKYFYKDVK